MSTDNDNVAVVATSTGSVDFVTNIEDYPLTVVRLRIIVGGEPLIDGVSERADTLLQRLYEDPGLSPKTTPPPEDEILSALTSLKAKGHENILVVTVSKMLSKTHEIVSGLAKGVEGVNIVVYDSETFALPEGLMAFKAAQLAKQGHSIEKIVKVLDRMKYDNEFYFCLNDMNVLYGHDYVGLNQLLATRILKIKPIIGFKKGEFYLAEKVRKFDNAIERLAEIYVEKVKNPNLQPIGLLLGNVEAYSKFINLLPEPPKLEFPISPVAAAHIGLDGLAVAFTGKMDKYG